MHKLAIYHFETLIWISRLGTFRAAAERLNTSQPAISARVREIEGQLGVELFQRNGRRVELTARGRQLVKECEPLIVGFERALSNAGDFAGTRGIVRIGSGEIAASSCLPGFVAGVMQDMPGLTVEIELDLTSRMIQQLLAGKFDLVFLAGPIAIPDICTMSIGEVELVWLACSELANEGVTSRPLPIWSIGEYSPIHHIMERSLSRNSISPASKNFCNNVQTIIQILSAGSGVALLPETMVKGAMQACKLVEVSKRPDEKVEFQACIRAAERDPLILELFRRCESLQISQ